MKFLHHMQISCHSWPICRTVYRLLYAQDCCSSSGPAARAKVGPRILCPTGHLFRSSHVGLHIPPKILAHRAQVRRDRERHVGSRRPTVPRCLIKKCTCEPIRCLTYCGSRNGPSVSREAMNASMGGPRRTAPSVAGSRGPTRSVHRLKSPSLCSSVPGARGPSAEDCGRHRAANSTPSQGGCVYLL